MDLDILYVKKEEGAFTKYVINFGPFLDPPPLTQTHPTYPSSKKNDYILCELWKRKMTGAPKNQGVDTSLEAVGHFGAP